MTLELRAKTDEFKKRLADGETLDDLLVEAYAAVREASVRTIGLRHYDVQMIGGIVLHQGRIAEMKTGEGKTLVATLPLYLNALTGQRCPSGYAERLSEQVRCAADGADLSCAGYDGWLSSRAKVTALIPKQVHLFMTRVPVCRRALPESAPQQTRECYDANITYGTNNEFGFDYLRDNMVVEQKPDGAAGESLLCHRR